MLMFTLVTFTLLKGGKDESSCSYNGANSYSKTLKQSIIFNYCKCK